MIETLTHVTKFCALVFFLTSMAGIGLGLTLREITAPLEDVPFVLVALLANFVLAPLLAIGIARVMNLGESFSTGLLLLGLGAGAPFMPKIAGIARGDLAQAVALMVLSMIATTIFLPLALPLLIQGVAVDPLRIAGFLLVLLLLPLAAGLAFKARKADLATLLRPVFERISSLALLLMLLLILGIHFQDFLNLIGTRAIAAALLFSILTALTGWILGGRKASRRTVLCMGTGLRNIPAALVVSVQNFPDPQVPVMVLVTTLIGMILLLPAAFVLGKPATAS